MLASSSSSSEVPPEPRRRRLRLSDILLHKKFRLKLKDQRPKWVSKICLEQQRLILRLNKKQLFFSLAQWPQWRRPPSVVQTCLEACEVRRSGESGQCGKVRLCSVLLKLQLSRLFLAVESRHSQLYLPTHATFLLF